MQTLKTGLILVVLMMVFATGALRFGAMTKEVTPTEARACRNALTAVASQLGAAIVQNPNLAGKLSSISPVTSTIPVTVYGRNPNGVTPNTVNASITAQPSNGAMNITATIPGGTTCSSKLALTALTLPNGTNAVGDPTKQASE